MIRETIARLVEHQDITREEAHATMREIMGGEATEAQIASFITALRMHGESPAVIAGCAAAMRENFTAVEPHADVVVDVVGTGGDCAHTFNISTASAIVTSGAGITVAKHGNRSVSSKSGAADVLGALGVNITCAPEIMSQCLKEIGLAFLFAPALHPAMKYAIGPRREIGIRTIFNILGPISNPASARHGLLGVYSADLVPVMAEACASLGVKHLFVVHGMDGLDEITLTTTTQVAEVKDGRIENYQITPATAGLETCTPDELVGGEPEDNATIIRAILDGESGPKRDVVLLNSAAAIVSAGKASDLKEGVQVAAESIDSGAAKAKLEKLIALTKV
ncbi:MAG: anthranilate phosphoribosyltransferase [Verrucomicrobia bacterium]|nr:anthranilate phosphoribosyltransferase [Verrucomicrobiota bacterium]